MKSLALTAAIAALALTGCSSAPEAISPNSYYDHAREYFTDSTDAELDSFAADICGTLEGGDSETSWLFGVKRLTDAGMDGEEAGRYLVFAASYACPEMLERFPSAA